MSLTNKNEQIYEGGTIVSHGIAMGRAFVMSSPTDISYVPKYSITKSQVNQELARLESAIQETEEHLQKVKEQVQSEVLRKNTGFLDAHLQILRDPMIHEKIRKNINTNQMNIEYVLKEVFDELITEMGKISDEYFRDRKEDISDIYKQVMLSLMGGSRESWNNLEHDSIIIAYNISPTQSASFDKSHIKGIITEIGGKTSHSAIVARALEIPAIVGLIDIRTSIQPGDYIILDANHGHVIINPTQETIQTYQQEKESFDKYLKKLAFLHDLPAATRDGGVVELLANIEIPTEVDAARRHGADGIGLFRSEFLFMETSRFPHEEEQYAVYADVVKKMEGKPVVIRTMDLGGDKLSVLHSGIKENNPFLGWRSIRFSLSNADIFKKQLRALYRAGVHGQLKIMFPMISGLDELIQVKKLLRVVREELTEEGIPYADEVPIGIMIEVPSAVMIADKLASQVDFFSIGTNDLIQFTLAVDRENERISYLFNGLHPSVLKLIHLTIQAGNNAGIDVSMCGEMAGNPLYSVLLIGLGMRRLSMSSRFIPEVKKVIRNSSLQKAKELADAVMEYGTVADVERYVSEFMREHYPDMVDMIMP